MFTPIHRLVTRPATPRVGIASLAIVPSVAA